MKLAIIEDRMRRLKQYQDFDISNRQGVVIITGNVFSNLIDQLNVGELSSLNQYSVIAAHRSALDVIARDAIKRHCTIKGKPLIFFSGSITSSIFKHVEFPFLYLNSKDFYSANLNFFLDNLEQTKTVNLLILQFGLRWKMSLLLQLRNYIAVAQSKQLIKAGESGSNIEISELIRRVQDIPINVLIKDDLINEKTKEIFSGNVAALVTYQQVNEIKLAIDVQINKLL